MTREELLQALQVERFGPPPCKEGIEEPARVIAARRRVLAFAMRTSKKQALEEGE